MNKKKSNAEWQSLLPPEVYRICFEKGTEPAFSGAYWRQKEKGEYLCAACDTALFSSAQKYDSGSGWPSFWQAMQTELIAEAPDNSLAARRTEILCAACGAHLGHRFDDGPPPTGTRFCVNSLSLKFQPAEPSSKQGKN